MDGCIYKKDLILSKKYLPIHRTITSGTCSFHPISFFEFKHFIPFSIKGNFASLSYLCPFVGVVHKIHHLVPTAHSPRAFLITPFRENIGCYPRDEEDSQQKVPKEQKCRIAPYPPLTDCKKIPIQSLGLQSLVKKGKLKRKTQRKGYH